MATEIDKYKKYLTNAQVKALAEKQQQYNNLHADERVQLVQSAREQLDTGRRMLQNRGLASAGGSVISGEEPRLRARVRTPVTMANENLRRSESAQLETAAVTEANKTIAARNAATQRAAEQRAQEEAARLAAQKEQQKANQAKVFGTGLASSALKNFAAAKYNASNVPTLLQAKAQTPGTAKTNTEVAKKMIGLAGSKASKKPSLLQTRSDKAAISAAQSENVLMPQQNQSASSTLIDFANQRRAEEAQKAGTVEGQKDAYYQQQGYSELEDKLKTTRTDMNAAKAYEKQLKQQLRIYDRPGTTLAITPEQQKQKGDLQTKLLKTQDYIARLEASEKRTQEHMDQINADWRTQEAFIRYGAMSDDELEEQLAQTDEDARALAMRRMGDIFDQNNAMEEGRASAGNTSYNSQAQDELYAKQSGIRLIQNYRKQQANQQIVQNAQSAAQDKTATPVLAYGKSRESFKSEKEWIRDAVKNFDPDSEKETGSIYYKAVNDQDAMEALVKAASGDAKYLKGNSDDPSYSAYEFAKFMNPEETNTFNVLYKEQGAEAADRYFEALLPTLDQRGADKISDDAREFAKKYGILADIASVPINLGTGLIGPTANVGNAISGRSTGKMTAAALDFGGIIREQRQEGMSNAGRFLYGTGMSMADSLAAAVMTGGGGQLVSLGGMALGGSAYNSTYREALDRGLDANHAQATALAAGVFEMMFEELSLEKLVSIKDAGSVTEFAMNALKQAGFEASEEINTEVANILSDALINGDMNKLTQQYHELRDRGYSDKEAYAQVAKDAASDVFMAGVGGFVSGGVMGAGATAIRTGVQAAKRYYLNNNSEAAQLGKRVKANGWDAHLAEYQFEDKGAAELKDRGDLTNQELGYLYAIMKAEQNAGAVGHEVRSAKGGEQALREFKYESEDLQDLAGKETLTDADLSKLYAGMQQQQRDTFSQKLGAEGKETLKIFDKISYGEGITTAEARQIADNKAAIDVFNSTYGSETQKYTTNKAIKERANSVAARNRSLFGNQQRKESAKQNTIPDAPASVRARMTDDQLRLAAQPSETDKKGTVETRKGNVSYEYNEANSRFLTDRQRAAVSFAQAVANATGANIKVVDSMEANGMYDRATNTLTIALDSDRGVLNTASHELTHWLKENDPDGYAAFAKLLEEEINKIDISDLDALPDEVQAWIRENNQGEPLFETFVKYEQSRDSSLSEEDAREEAVAECCEPMLSSMDVQRRLANENLSTAKKIRDYLKRIYDNIDALLRGKNRNSREAKVMQSEMVNLKKIENAWADAIAKAGKKQQNTNASTGIKLQKRSAYNESERAIIDAYLRGVDTKLLNAFNKYRAGTYNRKYRVTGPVIDNETASAFESITGIDVKEYRLCIDYVGFEHVENRHGLNGEADQSMKDPNDVARLWYAIQNANEVRRATNKNGNLLFSERYMDKDNRHAPILETRTKIDGTYYTSIVVPDASRKTLWVNSAFINKKETVEVGDASITDTPPDTSENSLSFVSVIKIPREIKGVKTKLQKRDIDTPQFKRWFGKSKVVNEDGTPKVMYHGTPNGTFNVFRGWQYFTDDPAYAEVYQGRGASSNGYKKTALNPKTYEVYLKAEKPFDTRNTKERRIFEREFFGKWGNGTPLSDRTLPDWTDWDDLIEFLEENGYDYDSIVLDEGGTGGYGMDVNDRGISWVIRDPRQIKSATDNVGAFDPDNPDIRYQKRDSEYKQRINEIFETTFPKQQEAALLRKQKQEIEQSEEYKKVMNGFPSPSDPSWDKALDNYLSFLNDSGYKDITSRIERLEKEISDANKEIEKLSLDEEYKAREKAIADSGSSEADYSRKQAVKEFGYTPFFYDAGYILPNGKMLNFSGEKGMHYGSRGEDHRAIGVIYPDVTGSEAMIRFMRDGNIRIMGETPGLDIISSMEPTREQYAKIRSFAAENAGERFFSVDLTDENGQSVGALVYDGRINPDRIINDIKHFFETGEIRGQSDIDRFRYQKRDESNMTPIFDDETDPDRAQKPRTDTAEIDNVLDRQSYKTGLNRLLARKKNELKEWAKKTSTAEGKVFKEADVKRLASSLIKTGMTLEETEGHTSVKSSMNRQELTERLAALAPRVWNSLHGNTDVENAWEDSRKLVSDILRSVEGRDASRADDFALLRSNVPKTIYLSEVQEQEVRNAHGNIYAYAKKLKSALGDQSIVVRKATDANTANLDANWKSITDGIANDYADISDADQPLALLDIASGLKPTSGKIYQSQADMERAAEQLTDALVSGVIELVPVEQNITTEQAQKEVMQELADRAAFFKKKVDQLETRYEKLNKEYADARKDSREDVREYEKKLDALNKELQQSGKLVENLEKKIRQMDNRQVKDMARELRGLRKRMEREIDKANRNVQDLQENATAFAMSAAREAQASLRTEMETQHNAEMKKMRSALAEETARGMAAARVALAEQRKAHVKESLKKERQAYAKGKSDTREQMARKNLQFTIAKNLDKLATIANRPNKNQHVPVELMEALRSYMQTLSNYALDPNKTMDAKSLIRLRDAYMNLEYEGEGVFAVIQDQAIKDQLQALVNITEKKPYEFLTSDELKMVRDTLNAVTTEITNANRLIGRDAREGIYEQAAALIKEIRDAQPVKGGKYLYRFLSPIRFARAATNYKSDAVLVQEMEELNKGAIEKERIAMEGNKLFADFITKYGKEYEKWQGKHAEWIDTGWKGFFDGKPVYITPAMKLSLIMHAKNTQNMNHIIKGGITVPDMELYKKGKIADAYNKGQRVLISAGEILNLEATLTDAEKAYLRCADELFNKYAPKAINKTSLELYGYRKAQVKNYFPIRTDANFNRTNFENVIYNGSIEGMGMLKERADHAANPIMLEDISSAVKRQIENTALFSGLAIPVRNFTRIFNTSLQGYEDSVKATLSNHLGEDGMKVLEKILTDLQTRPKGDSYKRVLGRLQSGYVQATLAVNLSVTMKQAASYPTAAAVVGWKPLLKALAKGGRSGSVISRADMDLIDRYTPLLYIRQQGMIDRDVADFKVNGKTWAEKMPGLMDWIRKVDVATVGRLWYAAEYYVQDTNPDLVKGSEAYYQETANVFNRIVQETQPNYTVMQRPDVLRTESDLMRSITMFKTQSFQNGGIILDAIGEFRATRSLDATDGKRIAANRKLANMITSQVIQNVVLTGMTLLANAITQKMNPWRDDDDEITPESIANNFALSMASNTAGSFWLGSELFDVIMAGLNKATGKELYAVYDKSSPVTDVINDLRGSIESLGKTVNLITNGEKDSWDDYRNQLRKIATGVSELTGVPYKNIMKLITGAQNWYKDVKTATQTGEIDWFRSGSKALESEKTAAAYKEWTGAGNSGKTFFYYKNTLKGYTADDKRLALMDASDLTPDQKAMLEGLLIYSGSKETRVENGRFQVLEDDGWSTVTNYADPTMFNLSQMSSARYENAQEMIDAGIKPEKVEEAWKYFLSLDGSGRNERFRQWLMEQPYTAAEKATIDRYVIGNKKVYDYTNDYAFTTSAMTDSQKLKTDAAVKSGVPEDKAVEAMQLFSKKSTTQTSFREWLYKQNLTAEQKTALDKAFTGKETVPDYTDSAWLDVYNMDGSSAKTMYGKAKAAFDEAGVSPETFAGFYEIYKTIDGKDANGNTSKGLKRKRIQELIQTLGLTKEQRAYMYKHFL